MATRCRTGEKLPGGCGKLGAVVHTESEIGVFGPRALWADPSSDGDTILAILHAQHLQYVHGHRCGARRDPSGAGDPPETPQPLSVLPAGDSGRIPIPLPASCQAGPARCQAAVWAQGPVPQPPDSFTAFLRPRPCSAPHSMAAPHGAGGLRHPWEIPVTPKHSSAAPNWGLGERVGGAALSPQGTRPQSSPAPGCLEG